MNKPNTKIPFMLINFLRGGKTAVATLFYRWSFTGFGAFSLVTFSLISSSGWAQERCATVQHDSVMARRVSGWSQSRQQLESMIQRAMVSRKQARTAATLIRIPVVVHVVHNNASGTIGGADNGNISQEQITSQIRVLNEDYRRQVGTNGYNTNPVGADMEIEFYLATRDPNGSSSSGITRTYSSQVSYDVVFGNDAKTLANLVSWPADRYLNIWVTTFNSNAYLGLAQYPSTTGVAGLDTAKSNDASTDGVIISHRAFGSNTGTATGSSNIYKDGRTATHEIGHWLGLIHTWGDAVCGDDYCADTPPAEHSNNTRFCTDVFSNCNGTQTRNMIENYLDYSPDLCMNIFTEDQKERVRAVLDTSPRRKKLIDSINEMYVSIAPNPVKNTTINFTALFEGFRDLSITLYDLQGHSLASQQLTNQYSNSFSLNRAGLRGGLYLLRVAAGGEEKTLRVLLQD